MTEGSNLLHYHTVLKQFLDISSDNLTPVTSSRVVKAREKLGKLTKSQFVDLSTDVYDELQRRINENNSEKSDFLLPKSSFHPKRNQARQKLASLPSTRFKDLVNDVLFEIERHEPDLIQRNDKLSLRVIDDSAGNMYNKSPKKHEEETTTPIREMFDNVFKVETPSQREIKSTMVVPQKSELSWSSDEEEPEPPVSNGKYVPSPSKSSIKSNGTRSIITSNGQSPQKSEKQMGVAAGSSHRLSNSRGFDVGMQTVLEESSMTKISKLEKELADLESKNRTLTTTNESLIKEMSLLQDELEESQVIKDKELESREKEISNLKNQLDQYTQTQEQHTLQTDQWQQEKEKILQDYNSVSENCKSLEYENGKLGEKLSMLEEETKQQQVDRGELEQWIQRHQDLEIENKSLKESTANADELESLKLSHFTLVKEHELLKKSVSNHPSSTGSAFESPQRSLPISVTSVIDKQQLADLNNDLLLWQSRYEEARSDQIIKNASKPSVTDSKDLQLLTSGANRLFSSKDISTFIASVDSTILYISDNHVQPNILFEKVALIVTNVNNLINKINTEDTETSQQVRLVQSSISNALTSTRYFVIYKDIIPKLVINTAINDVCFAVSDLMKIVKLKENSDKVAPSIELNGSQNLLSTDIKANELTGLTTTQPFEAPISSQESEIPARVPMVEPSVSGVRPLKITQKLSQDGSPILSSGLKAKPAGILRGNNGFGPISPIQVTAAPNSFGDREIRTPTQDIYKGSNVSVSSLASKFAGSNNINGSPTQDESNSVKSSPSSRGNNLLARMKKLQQSTDNNGSPTKSSSSSPIRINDANSIASSATSKAFDKFGAKRRSIDEGVKNNREEVLPTTIYNNPLDFEEDSKPNAPNEVDSSPSKNLPYLAKQSVNLAAPTPAEAPSSNKTIPSAGSALDYKEDYPAEEEDDFVFENFNTLNPDNTLKELLSYLEHQTVEVIAAIQKLLESIRDPKATKKLLRSGATQIINVVKQMAEGTGTLMNQSRYVESMGHAKYVVDVLLDCVSRMESLYGSGSNGVDGGDGEYAEKSFKQRSAGIAFDVARSTKELVKTVEEASLKDDIAVIDSRLNNFS